MSDYWVKPTVEQLQAELEWELQQMNMRRKRRNVAVSLAVLMAVVVVAAAAVLPRFTSQAYPPTYAMETEQAEEELPIDIVDGKAVVQAK